MTEVCGSNATDSRQIIKSVQTGVRKDSMCKELLSFSDEFSSILLINVLKIKTEDSFEVLIIIKK